MKYALKNEGQTSFIYAPTQPSHKKYFATNKKPTSQHISNKDSKWYPDINQARGEEVGVKALTC